MILSGIDDVYMSGVSSKRGFTILEESPNLGLKFGRGFLVGVQIEQPEVAALAFGEPLLLPKARPIIVNDAGAETARELDCAIIAAAIDDDHLIDPADDRPNAPTDPLDLVLADDETGNGQPG
jgi:hypothetical protein